VSLPTCDKPSSACLATRIPYGRPITTETLARIEQAEYTLHDLGFHACRVRDYDTLARVEVPLDQLDHAVTKREEIVAGLKKLGYAYVSLDLEGLRSGSMNETLNR